MSCFKSLKSVLFTAFLCVSALHAQSNFLPGYVINQKGDTVYGKIDYQNWEHNPAMIIFQPAHSAANSTYFPNDILEFKVLDEKYVSAFVQIETSLRSYDQLSFGGALQFNVQNVFLHTLFEGSKNLYVFQDKVSNDFFYYKVDTTFHLLLYKKYINNVDDNNLMEVKRYVGQLLYYFSDAPSLKAQINQTEYTQPSLVNLYKKYYQSSKQHMAFEKRQEKNIVKFGVVAGLTRTTLVFSSSEFPELVEADYKPSYNLSPAISIEFIQSRNRQKMSLYNEVFYTPYQVKGYAEDPWYTYQTEMHFHYLHLISMLRYSLPLASVRPFINGGFSFGYLVACSNKMTMQSKIYTDRTEHVEALKTPRKIEFAYNAGIGIKIKPFTFEYRAMIGNGMSPYFNLESDAVRNMLLVGYTF